MSSNQNEIEAILTREGIHKQCEKLVGSKITNVKFPGTERSSSWAVSFENGNTHIVTNRSNHELSKTEINVLGKLAKHDISSPAVVAADKDGVFLQQQLNGMRLSKILLHADQKTIGRLLNSALLSLAKAQHAGSKEKLDSQLPVLGAEKEWILDLVNIVTSMGVGLVEPPPTLEQDELVEILQVRHPRFVKWDASPSNAIVQPDGTVAWYSWENACARNRIDDMVWLLCDEFVPYHPEIESQLISRYLPAFADGRSTEDAEIYLRVYGVFHMLVKLNAILGLLFQENKWLETKHCIELDEIGMSLECAERTCYRAAKWAQCVPLTQPLTPWFGRVGKKMSQLIQN